MTVGLFIKEAVLNLNNSSILTARLDTEVIVSNILGVDRSWLQAHNDDELPADKEVELIKKIDRRARNEPVAYILGYKEFYGRNFYVNKDVLVPRPESELFIELLGSLKNIKSVLDIGTGSGCLAITAKIELSSVDVYATDISNLALKIASTNAKNLGADVTFKLQNLLDNDKNDYDVILANLPYVPKSMQNKSIMHEPDIALFSGEDGLYHYKKLFLQLKEKSVRYILIESLEIQHVKIEKLAKQTNYKLKKTDGLVQLFTKLAD